MAAVISLLLAGLFLLALEVLLPGLVAGIVGVLCLGAAVVLAYRDFGVLGGNAVFAITSTLLVVGTFVWFRFFPRSTLGQRFVSQGTVGDIGTERPELLEQSGTALTHLRPSGAALIGGRRVDVVTEGPMVERGSPVRVVAVEGMRVVVRKSTS
jgi:membrane-bound serine protease (ClpP class)